MTTTRETINNILDALQADEDSLPEKIQTCEVINRTLNITTGDEEAHQAAEFVLDGLAFTAIENFQEAMMRGVVEGKSPQEVTDDCVYAFKVGLIRAMQFGKKIGQGMFDV